ncbi:MAG: hypothetical protein ACYC77_05765 [Coriobacteriia bacterium]
MSAVGTFSRRTWTILAFGVAMALAVQMLVMSGIGGEAVTTAISDFGGVIIVGMAAIITIRTALAFGPGEALRRQWLFVGLGIALYVMGDLLWTYIEVIQQADVPYPGLPDVFYVSLYAFLGYGLVSAAWAYRGLVDVKRPLVMSAIVSLGAAAALYFVLLKDIFADPEVLMLEKVLDVYYPLADTLLLLGPALFIVFVVSQLGRGALGTPWRFVVAGAAVLAVADTLYQWLEWQELYQSGHIVDLGWMLGYVFIAVGASTMRDLILPTPASQE